MYGGKGGACGAVACGGGGLAVTGPPIAIMIVLALVLVVAGLLVLRWGTVRRPHS